jgi:uncharacterized protein YggE
MALLATVVVIGASSIYLGSMVFLQRSPGGNLQNQVTQRLHSYAVIGQDPLTTTSTSSNTITVLANGQANYTPNEALVQVSVQTQDTTAEAATQANAQHMTSVISALESIGISNGSLQTENFNLYANYASCYNACIPSITGYTAYNSILVNFTSNSATTLGLKAGQIIDTAVKAGANQVNLNFGATQSLINRLTTLAIHNAVSAADSQAQAIASSLGVSIIGVVSASEGGSPYSPGPDYGLSVAGNAAPSTPIIPGTQTISMSIQVVYSI